MGELIEITRDEWWMQIQGSIVRLGISEQLQEDIGQIHGVTFAPVGSYILENDIICELEAEKFDSKLPSILEGEILEFNQEALMNPELLNSLSTKENWLVLMKVTKDIDINNHDLSSLTEL
jgi:glycine cleavage system H protein